MALSACVYALGLRPGDEVILPGYTCVVVANAFRFAGVVPVFADIELETYGLDAGSAARRITPRTRALLLHHLYGLVCRDYEALLDLARRHGLPVVEDCAQATGAVWQGEKVGNRGEMGFYSFEESKVMTTILGGMAVTGDDRLAARLREYQERAPTPAPERVESILRTALLDYYQLKHPKRWFFGDVAHLLHGKQRIVSTSQEEEQGTRPADYRQRMPSPIAALGRNQLAKVDRYNELRRQAALRWDRWCDEGGYRRPVVLEGSVPVFLRYPVMVSPEMKRDLSWAESSLGVSPGVWFTSPLHPAPSVVDDCPNADEAVRRCVNFPCLPGGT